MIKRRLYNINYEEAEITEEIRNSTKPEDMQKCIKAYEQVDSLIQG